MQSLPRTRRCSGQPEASPRGAEEDARKVTRTCGNPKVSGQHFKHLRQLGIEIDAGRQPLVFDGGFVGLSPNNESDEDDEPEAHPWNRSPAGSRQGQRTRSRSGPTRKAESFSSRAVEEAHGVEFRALARHYQALGFEDRNGLWAAVRAKPLGHSGPHVHLLVAVPLDKAITPRAWAFGAIGDTAGLLPLKHTNFPDASICAFTKVSQAWTAADGLTPLVDHYSLWIVKSWHRSLFGWWPGPQVGACALYRRQEFVGRELCGCESGKRYSDCHQFSDLQVADHTARRQFRALFAVDYEDRQPPNSVVEAARTRWRKLPDMAAVFAHRLCRDEPFFSLC